VILWQIAGIVFPVFAIVAVGSGYGLRHAPDMGAVNRINMDVFVPALIFSVLSEPDVPLAGYSALALGAVVVVMGSGLLAWPLARWLHYQPRTFVPPVMFNNSGNMGLPLALLAFGESGLPAAVVVFVVENFLHFTVGTWLLAGRPHPLQLVRVPMLVATLLGVLFNVAGLALPGPLDQAIDMLGQVSIPLMLFALGVRMITVDLTHWRIAIVGTLAYPVAGVLCAFGAAAVLELSDPEWAQLLVFSVLPPAVLNYMLAEQYAQEPAKVASMVLLGNLSAIVVIPVVLAFVL
jgi:predicted permease